MLPLEIEQAWVDQIAASMPELPDAKKARFMADFGLTDYDANVLTADLENAAFFEAVAKGRGIDLAGQSAVEVRAGQAHEPVREASEHFAGRRVLAGPQAGHQIDDGIVNVHGVPEKSWPGRAVVRIPPPEAIALPLSTIGIRHVA